MPLNLRYADEYRGAGAVPFPDESSFKLDRKDKGYFLSCTQAIFSKYVNNKCWIPYDTPTGKRSFEELTLYSKGMNSPDKYKNILCGKPDEKTGRRRTTMTISWDTMQVLTEKLDVVKGYMMKLNYDINTSAVDYQAMADKQMMIANAKLMSDDRMKVMRNTVNKLAGQPVLGEEPPLPGMPAMAFNSQKEVDMFATVGGIYLEQEAALYTLLDKTRYESSWDVIKDQLIDDLLTWGITGTCTYTEATTGFVKTRRVDSSVSIIPYFEGNDSKGITWAAEIRPMNIAEIRKETNLSERELIEIAKAYAGEGYLRRAGWGYGSEERRSRRINSGFDMKMMDQIEVDVVDAKWVGMETSRYTQVVRKEEKRLVLNKVSMDYEIPENQRKKGKTDVIYNTQCIYKCKMVLGTGIIFDYGHDTDIGRRKDSTGKWDVVFPYHFVKTGSSSIVERCITFVDDANLSVLKLRNAKTKMPAPPNLYIKKSALENVQIDGVQYKPHELIKLLQDEGFLLVEDQDPWGKQSTVGKAIEPIPTDIIKQLVEWRLDVEWNIAMIEKVTGINEIFSAQTPASETGLGVARLAISATNNALFPIVRAYEFCFEKTMRIAAYKWQTVAKYMPKKQRDRLSINRAIKYVKIGADLDKYDFDIQLEAGVTEDEKLQLFQDIARLRDIRRQAGLGGITQGDYLLIWSMIKAGNIRQAQLLLAQIEEMRAEEDRQDRAEAVEQNMQSQLASNQQTAENEAALQQNKGDIELRNKTAELDRKAANEARLEIIKGQQKRMDTAIQNTYGWSNRSYTRPNR